MKVIGSIALVLSVLSAVTAAVLVNVVFPGGAWIPFTVFTGIGLIAIAVTAFVADEECEIATFGLVWFLFMVVITVAAGALHGSASGLIDGNNPYVMIWGAYAFGTMVYLISALVQLIADDW